MSVGMRLAPEIKVDVGGSEGNLVERPLEDLISLLDANGVVISVENKSEGGARSK